MPAWHAHIRKNCHGHEDRPYFAAQEPQEDQEAIDVADNTEFGLARYFYSRDIGREGSSHGYERTHRNEVPHCLGTIQKQSWSKPE